MHLNLKNIFVKLYNIYLSRLYRLLYRITEQRKHICLGKIIILVKLQPLKHG